MKLIYILAFAMIVLGAGAAGNETEADEYKTEVHENGDEEEIAILDKNGQVVGTVDRFENEGYQIDKPTDGEGHVCLLRKFDDISEEDNSADICYKRSQVSYEEAIGMNMSRILDHCGNRSLYILQTQDCDRMYTTETGIGREKRSWPRGNYCCHYKTYTSVRCVREVNTSQCCKKVFFFCVRRCTRCVQWSIKYITELLSHYG